MFDYIAWAVCILTNKVFKTNNKYKINLPTPCSVNGGSLTHKANTN